MQNTIATQNPHAHGMKLCPRSNKLMCPYLNLKVDAALFKVPSANKTLQNALSSTYIKSVWFEGRWKQICTTHGRRFSVPHASWNTRILFCDKRNKKISQSANSTTACLRYIVPFARTRMRLSLQMFSDLATALECTWRIVFGHEATGVHQSKCLSAAPLPRKKGAAF